MTNIVKFPEKEKLFNIRQVFIDGLSYLTIHLWGNK